MRILLISRAYGEQAGGMERLSFEFIQSVRQLPQVQVRVLANHTRPNSSLFSSRLRSAVFAVTVIPRALAAAKSADIVHIGDPVLSLVGRLIKILIKKPVIVTVHGLDILYPNSLYQLYLRMFLRDFDMFLPISAYVAKQLEARGVAGRIEVLTPGMKDIYADSSVSRKHLTDFLQLDTTEKIILFTSGRLVKRKGHEWFIRNVLPELPRSYIYVVAGSGPEFETISKAIEETSQAERVRMLGRISAEDLKILYNAIDIFVQPNIAVPGDAEGFGLVLVEAASCNRLVIASDVGGIPSAIHDGNNGCLLPAQDSKLWINAILHEEPIADSRRYTLDMFSWPVIATKFYALVSALGTR